MKALLLMPLMLLMLLLSLSQAEEGAAGGPLLCRLLRRQRKRPSLTGPAFLEARAPEFPLCGPIPGAQHCRRWILSAGAAQPRNFHSSNPPRRWFIKKPEVKASLTPTFFNWKPWRPISSAGVDLMKDASIPALFGLISVALAAGSRSICLLKLSSPGWVAPCPYCADTVDTVAARRTL